MNSTSKSILFRQTAATLDDIRRQQAFAREAMLALRREYDRLERKKRRLIPLYKELE